MIVHGAKRRRPVTYSFVYTGGNTSEGERSIIEGNEQRILGSVELECSVMAASEYAPSSSGISSDTADISSTLPEKSDKEEVVQLIRASAIEADRELPLTKSKQFKALKGLDQSKLEAVSSTETISPVASQIKERAELCETIVNLNQRLKVQEELQELRSSRSSAGGMIKLSQLEDVLAFTKEALIREQEKVVALCRENVAMRNDMNNIDQLVQEYTKHQLSEVLKCARENKSLPTNLQCFSPFLEDFNCRTSSPTPKNQLQQNYNNAVMKHRMELYRKRSEDLQLKLNEAEEKIASQSKDDEAMNRITNLEVSLSEAKMKCWEQLTAREGMRLNYQDMEERLEELNSKFQGLAEESDTLLQQHRLRLEVAHERLQEMQVRYSKLKSK